MRLIESKQKNVLFIFCANPCTIDKKDWGSKNNMQIAPDGAFFKINEGNEMTVSHLVQPDKEFIAPIGWMKKEEANRYDKAPIWVEDDHPLEVGSVVTVDTADGKISYEVKETSYLCYNNDKDGRPSDCWVQTEKNLKKNYDF